MPVPVTYRTGGEGAIASYNYTDVAEGTGVIAFQGFNVGTSGAIVSTKYILGTQTLYSYEVESAVTSTTAYPFNLSAFNLPKTVKGTATLRFSVQYNGNITENANFVAEIFKVSGGTPASMGSACTDSLTSGGSAIIKNIVLRINLNETPFKKGDNLRITITPYLTQGTAVLAHDPANRDGTIITPATTYPTKLEAHIPFKLDL